MVSWRDSATSANPIFPQTRPDPTLSSNTRAILSNIRGNLQYLTVKRLKYCGSSLDLNPSHTCIRAVSAQHNYTTMLGWLTCNERWLKNETPYHSCEWPDWWAAWGRGARLLGGSSKLGNKWQTFRYPSFLQISVIQPKKLQSMAVIFMGATHILSSYHLNRK